MRLADETIHPGEVECHSIFDLGVALWGGCRLALLARLTEVRAEAQATADMVAGDLLHRRGIAEAGKVLARRARQRELYHARKRARTSAQERIRQAGQVLENFEQELDTLHKLDNPTPHTLDWRFCTSVKTVQGNVPVAPMRIRVINQLKNLLTEHDPDPLNKSTLDDCKKLKRLARLVIALEPNTIAGHRE